MTRLRIYYDGGCPVCAAEIALYRRRPGADAIGWTDVSQPGASLGPGLTRDAALKRIHVRRPDGTLVSGAAAFAAVWQELPGLRWLGRLVALPPVTRIAEVAYRAFLLIRKPWRASPGPLGRGWSR